MFFVNVYNTIIKNSYNIKISQLTVRHHIILTNW